VEAGGGRGGGEEGCDKGGGRLGRRRRTRVSWTFNEC
jgi:hypothetical protein